MPAPTDVVTFPNFGSFFQMFSYILKDITANTEFTWGQDADPIHIMLSEDGKLGIDGVCFRGVFRGNKAVLKVRGVKKNVDEGTAIRSFFQLSQRDDEHNTLRPPFLFDYLPWDSKKGYEALIMEDVGDTRLISIPPGGNELAIFFNLYEDYHELCVRTPWEKKPEISAYEFIHKRLEHCKKEGEKYRGHKHRHAADAAYIERARTILLQEYKDIELEFQHAPFLPYDLFYEHDNEDSDTFVMMSNQTWAWYPPFFDITNGYYYYLAFLSQIPGMNELLLEEQSQMWTDGLLIEEKEEKKKKLMILAKLEEATAWLSLYAIMIPEENLLSEFVVDKARENLLSTLLSFPQR